MRLLEAALARVRSARPRTGYRYRSAFSGVVALSCVFSVARAFVRGGILIALLEAALMLLVGAVGIYFFGPLDFSARAGREDEGQSTRSSPH